MSVRCNCGACRRLLSSAMNSVSGGLNTFLTWLPFALFVVVVVGLSVYVWRRGRRK